MRVRLRIRSLMVIVALVAIALMTPAAIRDQREFDQLGSEEVSWKREIRVLEFWRLRSKNSTPIDESSEFSKRALILALNDLDGRAEDWSEDRPRADRSIARRRARLRAVQRRRDEIRRRWLLPPLKHDLGD